MNWRRVISVTHSFTRSIFQVGIPRFLAEVWRTTTFHFASNIKVKEEDVKYTTASGSSQTPFYFIPYVFFYYFSSSSPSLSPATYPHSHITYLYPSFFFSSFATTTALLPLLLHLPQPLPLLISSSSYKSTNPTPCPSSPSFPFALSTYISPQTNVFNGFLISVWTQNGPLPTPLQVLSSVGSFPTFLFRSLW